MEKSDFCLYHDTAYDNLRKAFESWKLSLKIDWPCFLREITENSATGDWVKEIANYLINKKFPASTAPRSNS
jgi:hypothetical protein